MRPLKDHIVEIIGHAVLPPGTLELRLEHRIVRKAQVYRRIVDEQQQLAQSVDLMHHVSRTHERLAIEYVLAHVVLSPCKSTEPLSSVDLQIRKWIIPP